MEGSCKIHYFLLARNVLRNILASVLIHNAITSINILLLPKPLHLKPLVASSFTRQRLIRNTEAERRELFQWLSTVPYKTHHTSVGKNFLLGTGVWLTKKPEFLNWRRSSSSAVLWLHGIRMYVLSSAAIFCSPENF